MRRWIPLTLAAILLPGCAGAGPGTSETPAPAATQELQGPPARPVPYPVDYPPTFEAAIREGTRTTTGRPGPRYWQQSVDYKLSARVDPAAKRLTGAAEIRYHNESPDTLRVLYAHLAQNLHASGVVRFEPAEVTGGVEIERVEALGRRLQAGGASGPRYAVDGAVMTIVPHRPILPGETASLAMKWAFRIPQAGAGARMGYDEDNLLFLAYWYPQMAVYDDVAGWEIDPFVGTTEFYADYGSYDLTIEAPEGWLAMATGEITNPEEVLVPAVLARLRRAESSDSVVAVVGEADLGRVTAAGRGGWLRWHFHADSVRDAAFSLTRESLWDAVRTPVGDRNGDGAVDYARMDAIYRVPAFRWKNAARYGAHALMHHSEFTGLPYAWPHMSAVEGAGIIGGGMEFPMMTLIGDYTARGDTALYNVMAHELAHMWLPMMVNTDERRFSWLDEGTTSFNENQASTDFFALDYEGEAIDLQSYLVFARTGQEGEIMRRSAYHYTPQAYGVASYSKPATILRTLRGVLGEETFLRAYREFYDRWSFRHAYPWDLWNTFEDVSGRELDWFWRGWYYETWVLDQAVESVTAAGDSTRIVVEDRGRVPMPVRLAITTAGGERITRAVPVDVWLRGAATTTVTVPGTVVRVEIDPERLFPDVDRTNNVWERR